MNKQDAKEILMRLPYKTFSDLACYSHEYVLARKAEDRVMLDYQLRMLIGYMHCLTSLDLMDVTECDNLLMWLRVEDRSTEMNSWGRCKFLWIDTKTGR